MLKVLIAHISCSFADILADHLRHDYEVQICNTGSDALVLLDQLRPDILILYLSLPDLDGISVLHRSRYLPNVILALTNLASDCILQAALNAGAHDVVLLPSPVQHIVSRVEQIIKKPPPWKLDPERGMFYYISITAV